MGIFTEYDATTGKILSSFQCPDFADEFQEPAPGNAHLNVYVSNALSNYVDLNTLEIMPRQASPITVDKTSISANGIDVATFSNIPLGSTLYVNDSSYSVSGTETFSSETVGSFTILIDSFPYLMYQVQIDAN